MGEPICGQGGRKGSTSVGGGGGEARSPVAVASIAPRIDGGSHRNLVTLHLVTCKKKAPRNDGDTNEVSATCTPMLKSVMVLVSKRRGRALARKNYPNLNRWVDPLFIDVPRGLRCSGDPIGLDSEYSRQCRRKWAPCQSEQATDINDGTGAVTGGVSSVRRRIVSVVPGHCCQPVRGGVTQTVRAPPSGWCSSVVWLSSVRVNGIGPGRTRPGYTTGSTNVVDTWWLNEVPGEEYRPSWI
ncbi:hypothetical protein TIFTF001_026122 [Ficus carica]|uniref:Uncharacterized protein n=1 Tax=Ficus carica TaxID=3494 RepID=A0AA88DG30_FICCA|nr:hypothetical protein TIFTF001_026122 [Ficus carica]